MSSSPRTPPMVPQPDQLMSHSGRPAYLILTAPARGGVDYGAALTVTCLVTVATLPQPSVLVRLTV
jgi:hypothetical protein